MSFAIIRNQNHKVGAVPLVERHNERKNHNYSNHDIDRSRSKENFHLKSPQGSYWETFNKIRDHQQLKGNLRLQGEKQSTVLCEFIITSDKAFFDDLGADGTKRFFEDAYQFVVSKVGGEQFVVAAVVHMDEATPHMHVTFIPTVRGKDRKGQPCRRINCSEFWKGRDSYSRLQDEWYDWITHTCRYDLERGVKGSAAEHLSVAEYKLKKTQEQLERSERKVQEIENIENISSKNLPLNTIALKRSDYDKLKASAEAYITTRDSAAETAAENTELHRQVETLREEKTTVQQECDDLANKLITANEICFSLINTDDNTKRIDFCNILWTGDILRFNFRYNNEWYVIVNGRRASDFVYFTEYSEPCINIPNQSSFRFEMNGTGALEIQLIYNNLFVAV